MLSICGKMSSHMLIPRPSRSRLPSSLTSCQSSWHDCARYAWFEHGSRNAIPRKKKLHRALTSVPSVHSSSTARARNAESRDGRHTKKNTHAHSHLHLQTATFFVRLRGEQTEGPILLRSRSHFGLTSLWEIAQRCGIIIDSRAAWTTMQSKKTHTQTLKSGELSERTRKQLGSSSRNFNARSRSQLIVTVVWSSRAWVMKSLGWNCSANYCEGQMGMWLRKKKDVEVATFREGQG